MLESPRFSARDLGDSSSDPEALAGILRELSVLRNAINEQQGHITALDDNKLDRKDFQKLYKELKSAIENLESTKCDTLMVSRKAERDYVDAGLERLKKEVCLSLATSCVLFVYLELVG